MQCIEIDRCYFRTIRHRAVREALYATRLAEQVSNCFLVEAGDRQLIAEAIAHFLLRSSQIFGSHNSILLPSGSMIQANTPFS